MNRTIHPNLRNWSVIVNEIRLAILHHLPKRVEIHICRDIHFSRILQIGHKPMIANAS